MVWVYTFIIKQQRAYIHERMKAGEHLLYLQGGVIYKPSLRLFTLDLSSSI